MAFPGARLDDPPVGIVARLKRLAVDGAMHLVAQRGHGTGPLFIDDIDRQSYIDALRLGAAGQGVRVHAYALLDREVLWLATPGDAGALGRVAQVIGQRFASAFNRRHGLRGTRWDGRFRSAVVEPARHAVGLIVLLARWPVVRGLAATPAEWSWSTARHHLGQARLAWIDDPEPLWQLGNTPFERESAFRGLLGAPVNLELLGLVERGLASGIALGSSGFVGLVEAASGRRATAAVRGRPRSRPAI